jgi:hypothetical protein
MTGSPAWDLAQALAPIFAPTRRLRCARDGRDDVLKMEDFMGETSYCELALRH